ncbi:hypothetical protein TMU3MR103_0600 [Tetragenococcus muriaticus 3MR10-3]|uniref:DUF4352 domain-containing protein n=2 Tax=Tetragenococcus muriaticus TaxID=64642 RepID=A0A091C5E1_9ENTE|nr:hypothetical protein TMU3MR103_0600 [Tetragenococcus muriaticus 3MR10-3]
MAKKITDENGNTYKMKKPFYKRIWVWVLIVVVVFFGIGIFSEDEEAEKVASENSTEQTSEEEPDELDKDFTVGDTVSYQGVELTVNDIELREPSQDEIEFGEVNEGEQFVIANITLENKSDETLYYNMYDFRLNADGNAEDMDVYTEDVSDTISDGHLDKDAELNGNLVGAADPDKDLKFQYETDFWNDETVDINLN